MYKQFDLDINPKDRWGSTPLNELKRVMLSGSADETQKSNCLRILELFEQYCPELI